LHAFGRVLVGFAGGYLILNLIAAVSLAPRPSAARDGTGLGAVAADGENA
jgi:hypothetical protein